MILKIVGRGPLEGFLREWAKKQSNVKFLGYLTDDELIDAYRKAHVVIMLSRFEASPLVLNEALSFGCAVVAYDISTIRESIELRERKPRMSVKLVSKGSLSGVAKP